MQARRPSASAESSSGSSPRGVLADRLDVFDELCDPGVTNHAAAPQARDGVESIKRVIGISRAAMPDQRWTNQIMVADDEYVVVCAVRESTWCAESFRGGCVNPSWPQ
jgi:hypothetical protein